jgi:DNA-binding response OmpR family regulator
MKRVLIIEDERILGEMYEYKLKETGYEVKWVQSSEEAFEYLKKNKPTIILLDILLPKENGIDFLKKIKNTNIIENTTIVVFSNYDNPETKKEALKFGVKAYLIKTQYTPKELLEEIKKFLK